MIGGGYLIYLGGREAFRYFNKKKLEEGKLKILHTLKTSIVSLGLDKKKLTQEEVDKLITSWEEDLNKLTPAGLNDFIDYFNVTIAKGKIHPENIWAYEKQNQAEYERLKTKMEKFVTSEMKDNKLILYYDKTDLLNKFNEFAKNL